MINQTALSGTANTCFFFVETTRFWFELLRDYLKIIGDMLKENADSVGETRDPQIDDLDTWLCQVDYLKM